MGYPFEEIAERKFAPHYVDAVVSISRLSGFRAPQNGDPMFSATPCGLSGEGDKTGGLRMSAVA